MKILLVPKGFFGDIVLTTGVVSELKANHPDVSFSLLLPPSAIDLVRGHPAIDECIPFDRRGEARGVRGLISFAKMLRTKGFDRVYAFQKSMRTALLLWLAGVPDSTAYQGGVFSFLYSHKELVDDNRHEVLRALQLVQRELSPEQWLDVERMALGEEPRNPTFAKLSLPLLEEEKLSRRVRDVCVHPIPYLVLVPGSAWATKRWDPSNYRGVAAQWLSQGKRVVLLGAEKEAPLCEEIGADLPVINLAGQVSLPEMAKLISRAEGVVCNDSMALHVASACATPTVVVFCATSPRFGFGPWQNPYARVLEKEGLFCKPCSRHGSAKCPTGTRACMVGVEAKTVLVALSQLIDEKASAMRAVTAPVELEQGAEGKG